MRVAAFFVLGMAVALLGVCVYNLHAQSAEHYPGSYYFTDCSPTSPHDHDIGFLAEYGVTLGCEVGRYCPDDAIIRAQMASYIMRQTALDVALSVFVTDEALFGGSYTYQAYLDGYITLEEYQEIQALLEWYASLLEYQASVLASRDLSEGPRTSASPGLAPDALSAVLSALRDSQAAREE